MTPPEQQLLEEIAELGRARTVLYFEDRWVNHCALCTTEWVTFVATTK